MFMMSETAPPPHTVELSWRATCWVGSAESHSVAGGPLGATCPAPTQVGAPSLFILEPGTALSMNQWMENLSLSLCRPDFQINK